MRWCGVWTVICVLTMSILETFVHCYCSRSGGVVQICFPIAMKQREGLGKSYSEKSHVIKRSRHTWPTVRAAFDFYKRLYGNLDVPYNFSMPPSWNHPQQLQNMKLGHITSRIRTRGDFLEHHQELSSMGFQWAVKSTSLFEDTIEALIEYNCTYGNMNVPVKYCIQNSTLFSRQFWGMKLGRRLDHIRQGSYSSPLQRARLVNIGLNVSKLRDRRGIEVILDALRSYKNVHGHLQVSEIGGGGGEVFICEQSFE